MSKEYKIKIFKTSKEAESAANELSKDGFEIEQMSVTSDQDNNYNLISILFARPAKTKRNPEYL